MYTVSIQTGFNADHGITLPNGSVEKIHPHDWIVTVKVSRNQLPKSRMVTDFQILKAIVKNITNKLNNRCLNDIEYFQQYNCTAESVAEYIYNKILPELADNVKLDEVLVVEEHGCVAGFSK